MEKRLAIAKQMRQQVLHEAGLLDTEEIANGKGVKDSLPPEFTTFVRRVVSDRSPSDGEQYKIPQEIRKLRKKGNYGELLAVFQREFGANGNKPAL